IISSPITYGLGAGVVDINLDGWTDIYICNDFSLPDYLYINNGDGTFTDRLQEMLGHTSYASMGNNVLDVNNDGYPDIFSLDMLPEDNRRQKLLLAPNDYDFFELNLRLGFYHQYLRSMLHLNNGNGTFSEIGQIAGIDATDWSWSPLFADYDNDGWKDLLITNGYLRDYTNLDFLRNMDNYVKQNKQMKRADVLNLVNLMPETELYNYIYKNNGNATFTHINQDWGMTEGSYSNGAVYVDLDNDGDLDIVTNNINKPAFIYENKSNEISENNFLKVKLNGGRKNKFGHGAKVYLYHGDQLQMLEQQPARGYQSSVSTILHFGIGKINLIDSLKVEWQGGISQTKKNIPANKTIVLKEVDATANIVKPPASQPIFKEVPSSIKFTHAENDLNDFKRQPLMLNAKSF
ncbi:MAG: CRTAC1 family protein, partial [Cyclobacteriaceae bacterium]|nr:CRTAC1 family protein [Cyclobacteriaceae bacterium]